MKLLIKNVEMDIYAAQSATEKACVKISSMSLSILV